MTKKTMRRLVATARRVMPRGTPEAELERIARRVAASLAERRRPKDDPAWEGCR